MVPTGPDSKLPPDPPDDGKPLLERGADSNGSIDAIPLSSFAAHRRRLGALTQVVWDSGILSVCNASIFFSIAALFVKLIGGAIPVFQIVAVRSLSSFTVCVIYARIAHITPFFGHRANLRLLIFRGLFGAAAMTTYYFSLKMLPLADAVTLFFLNPAITAVAARLIMKEPLGLRGLFGVLVSLCGLVLLTRPPFLFGSSSSSSSAPPSFSDGILTDGGDDGASASLHGDGAVGVSTAVASGGTGSSDNQRLVGTMFGLLSALLSTGAFITIRYIGKSEPALVMSVYFHICAAATSLGPLIAGVPGHAVWPTGAQWALLLGVAGCSFWGQIFIGRGFQLLNAAKASAINLTQVVYSYILGLLFLHETLTPLGGAGSLLIGAGAILVNWKAKAKPNKQQAPAVEGDKLAAAGAAAAAADGEAAGKATAGRKDLAADPEAACAASPVPNGVAADAPAVTAGGPAGGCGKETGVEGMGGSGSSKPEIATVAMVEMAGRGPGSVADAGGPDGHRRAGWHATGWEHRGQEEEEEERRGLLQPARLEQQQLGVDRVGGTEEDPLMAAGEDAAVLLVEQGRRHGTGIPDDGERGAAGWQQQGAPHCADAAASSSGGARDPVAPGSGSGAWVGLEGAGGYGEGGGSGSRGGGGGGPLLPDVHSGNGKEGPAGTSGVVRERHRQSDGGGAADAGGARD